MKLIIFAGVLAIAMAELNDLLKESNAQFSTRIFNEVAKSNPDKSVILSGFSVLPPLAQLALASVGESHNQLLKVIGLPDDTVTKEVFKGFNSKLRAVKGVELKMANRVYVAKDAELNPTFAALSRDVFDSDVKNVDFANDATNSAKEINSWVEEQTNNKIKDLVDPKSLGPATRALLVNAIYFKGTWKKRFNKDMTKDGDFHLTKDITIQVPMMHTFGYFRYGESKYLDAKLIDLVYEGEESSLLIVVPNEIDGLNGLVEKLKDPYALPYAFQPMTTAEVNLTLPRFKIETTTDLKEILKKMEVTKLFSPGDAKLENLLNKESNLYISEAIQKAYIEVNEEGAEAAAANNVDIIWLMNSR